MKLVGMFEFWFEERIEGIETTRFTYFIISDKKRLSVVYRNSLSRLLDEANADSPAWEG